MMKKALAAMALVGVAMSAQADVAIKEGFDDITKLSKGWGMANASTPVGTTVGWYQGDQTILTSQSGAANSYISANYNNAAPGGTLANYLITPDFYAVNDDKVTFWMRSGSDQGYTDQVAFGYSTGGSAISDFIMSAPITLGTDGWSEYTYTINGLGAGGRARFAIAYVGAADSANVIGLDTLSVNVPEPASIALVAGGLLGLGAIRRRKQG
ncbi:choice-of-anchor J family PEP-CTERM protein [Massilia sp. 9096]|uniref:choice-of-anchor J family PEP-CTERM protein n=1 Tax=Massilia sp. 9096 TaxID=1500894 RepID=UPI000AE61500|nr:choice-of-anchor J domain-containing protein [Massilia sp. 9096]